jgi:hypothetical protein
MIQVEPIQNFNGFGIGAQQGEYFYSQGMCKTQFGLTPNWATTDEVTSGTLSGLSLTNWFATNGSSVFAYDQSGNIYTANLFSLNWAKAYTLATNSHGNGMIVDQTGRVLIAGDRYLSKWDGATAATTAGTVQVNTSSSAVIGYSTSFTSAMVGKQVTFSLQSGVIYTVSTVTDSTHLTLSSNYTGTGGFGNYSIYMGSTEQWKDFGSAFSTLGLRQMDLYEDWVVMANVNNVAILNVTDDSFNNQGLELPSGYTVATLRAGLSGILVGVNTNTKGAIFLWDAVANGSISEWIWFNANIKAIVPTNEGYLGYYVITTRGIYLTNGYIVTPIYEMLPDDRLTFSYIINNLTPNSITLIGRYLVFFGGSGFARRGQGIYIFNIETRCFEFAPVSNGVQYNLSMGGVFFDGVYNVHLGYSSAHPATTAIAKLVNAPPTSAYYITEPKGLGDGKTSFAGNEKTADAAKFTILENPRSSSVGANTYSVALKVYNFQRSLYSTLTTVSGTLNTTHITVNGTVAGGIPVAQIGDEVTVLEGVNAGQVAHITTIANQGTSQETWTVTTLPNTTEVGVSISVSPFKLVQTFTFSNLAQLRDVYFDIKNKYKGKRFLLKLLFTNISNTELDITDGQFIYSDQGLITS